MCPVAPITTTRLILNLPFHEGLHRNHPRTRSKIWLITVITRTAIFTFGGSHTSAHNTFASDKIFENIDLIREGRHAQGYSSLR